MVCPSIIHCIPSVQQTMVTNNQCDADVTSLRINMEGGLGMRIGCDGIGFFWIVKAEYNVSGENGKTLFKCRQTCIHFN